MGMISPQDNELVGKILTEALDHRLREALEKRFLEEAKPIIKKSIDDAMETFKIDIQRYMDYYRFGEVVSILLKDNRT